MPHRMSSAGERRCKRRHPSSALILKPYKLAVKPVCDRRATANGKRARHSVGCMIDDALQVRSDREVAIIQANESRATLEQLVRKS